MCSGNFSIEKKLKNDDVIQDQIDDIIVALIRERKRQKITQIKLSKMTGIPQATISRMESFASIPTLHIILKLSKALDLTLTMIRREEQNA